MAMNCKHTLDDVNILHYNKHRHNQFQINLQHFTFKNSAEKFKSIAICGRMRDGAHGQK
jgi:hypothetical protein